MLSISEVSILVHSFYFQSSGVHVIQVDGANDSDSDDEDDDEDDDDDDETRKDKSKEDGLEEESYLEVSTGTEIFGSYSL